MDNKEPTRLHFATDKLKNACLFTGAHQERWDGEHIIPDWMRRKHGLKTQPVLMGGSDMFGRVKTFLAPADKDANGRFGEVEDKVSRGEADADELHLWSRKISVGMIWNHWKLAQNQHVPTAPLPFDERLLHAVLQDFWGEFARWDSGAYSRTGSTVSLPTALEHAWLVHAFGMVAKDVSEREDLLMPFGYLAILHAGNLIVSAFNDDGLLESRPLLAQWSAAALDRETDDSRIRAALATTFAQHLEAEVRAQFGAEGPDFAALHRLVAYQLGIIVSEDGARYRQRTRDDES